MSLGRDDVLRVDELAGEIVVVIQHVLKSFNQAERSINAREQGLLFLPY